MFVFVGRWSMEVEEFQWSPNSLIFSRAVGCDFFSHIKSREVWLVGSGTKKPPSPGVALWLPALRLWEVGLAGRIAEGTGAEGPERTGTNAAASPWS